MCCVVDKTSCEVDKPKRHVQFKSGEGLCTVLAYVPSREDYSGGLLNVLWYSSKEISIFYDEARVCADVACKKACSKVLNYSFGTGMDAMMNGERRQSALNAWTKKGESFRGLEMACNSTHALMRIKQQEAAIYAILEAQALGMDAEEIANTSILYTRSARDFARRIAIADFQTEKQGPNKRFPHKKKSLFSLLSKSECRDTTCSNISTCAQAS